MHACVCVYLSLSVRAYVFSLKLQAVEPGKQQTTVREADASSSPSRSAASTLAATAAYLHFDWETVEAQLLTSPRSWV